MRIRKLLVENFRGIKHLEWNLPANQHLVVLIGPGDSGKSTVLDAIHYVLGDRWNLPFNDTDFYEANIEDPISITTVLTDLPDSLLKDSAFGLWLSGIDEEGTLHHDPAQATTPCLIVNLTVTSTLEPFWSVKRIDGDSQNLSSYQRRNFSTFKVDERNDTQLRWTTTSALGRLSREDGEDRTVLADASRAASAALQNNANSSLSQISKRVQEQANKVGGGSFKDIKPGLDASKSSLNGNLALYEGAVPLTSFGLGTRRLTSFATQQLAAGNRFVAVIDEIESGLEPHRAIRLLNHLIAGENYSQVIVTTHSPVIVEQAKLENLATVRSAQGNLLITHLGDSPSRMQRLRRSTPSALLARRTVLVEGRTEMGLLMKIFELWDQERICSGKSTFAGEGVAIQDASGGSEVAPRAREMKKIGYEVIALMDNDDPSVNRKVSKAEQDGIKFIRWETGYCLEHQVCAYLHETGLNSFLQLGTEVRASERTVIDDLNASPGYPQVSSLDVNSWTEHKDLSQIKLHIANTAIESAWFKNIEQGKALGQWIHDNYQQDSLSNLISRLDQIKRFVYPDIQENEDLTTSTSDE